MTYKILDPEIHGTTDPKISDPSAALREVIGFLKKGYGRVDPTLGEVQRLRRGGTDLPLGGGPEVLNAAYTKRVGEHLVGIQGDSLVMLVEFSDSGVKSESIEQYGASNRRDSPHYVDQAPLFVAHRFKPTLRDPAELAKHTERAYAPGEEAR
jgi:acyl-homoserine-lactone acylase